MNHPLRRPPIEVHAHGDLTARERLVQMARHNHTALEVQGPRPPHPPRRRHVLRRPRRQGSRVVSTYEPGTVAVATVRGVPNVRAFRFSEVSWVSPEPVMQTRLHHNEDVTDVRPLVMLDFEGLPFGYSAQEGRQLFPDWLRTAAEAADAADVRRDREPAGHGALVRHLADQIEQQTRRPPKPPEPTGLGAVVEDVDGVRWVRHCIATCPEGDDCDAWAHESDDDSRGYDELDAVRVLSEGVTP